MPAHHVIINIDILQDFSEMIVHHISTISLLSMSWSANMVRVGTLVLCVHDAVDYIMEVRINTRARVSTNLLYRLITV